MENSKCNSEITKEDTKSEKNNTVVGDNCYKLSTNIDANDLDKETAEKLKGDTIGDTLYSQSFVLKTLLQFSELQWNEQVEEDLCFLWDMTVEKDVCEFLLGISYPSITAAAVVQHSENNRFVEIVIGVLANVFCSGCDNSMTKEEIAIVLSLLQSDDPLVLVQVMRFISLSVESSDLMISLVDEDIFEQLCFILKNSVNTDLLLKTMEAVAKLTTNFRIKEALVTYNVYDSVMICYNTLMKMDGDQFDPDTKEKVSSIRYMVEIIVNVYTFIERFEKNELLSQIQANSNIFVNEILKILGFFCLQENLLPITDNLTFIMSAISYTYTNLKLNYLPDIFLSVTKILEQLIDIKDEVGDIFDSTLELQCYLISCTKQEDIHRDLKCLSRSTVKKVLNVVNENFSKYSLSSDISDSLLKYYKQLR
ncbi:uncharacterized protein LOC114327422 [Diabrotica virgifera virgifera]|uniref:Protein saal1-like n=1 Tax=Diabrotica virgifera virgifera TaxID=50390 RepID=A0ABM5IFW7_DIAVI|nr:uncharacterized protein LOC114327422 [Diabrotica virgifera virgifera]